jgi:hypothetical protein
MTSVDERVAQHRLTVLGTKFSAMNARIGAPENLMKPKGIKGATFEWNLMPATNPMVKVSPEEFCDDTDLVTNLVTKQKARIKRAC